MAYNLDVKNISKEEWLLANCKEHSLYIIQNYNKTEKQLRDKLVKFDKYNDDIIEKTMIFLKQHHFIDDTAYAKRYVEIHKNTYSIRVMKEKLYQKGIKKDIIDEVLNDEENNIDEDKLVLKYLLKKCPDYYEKKDDMDIKEKQKILSYLIRKGFNYSDVTDVMRYGM